MLVKHFRNFNEFGKYNFYEIGGGHSTKYKLPRGTQVQWWKVKNKYMYEFVRCPPGAEKQGDVQERGELDL